MAISETHTTGRITSGSRLLDLPSADWQPTDSPGFYIKPIFEDEATGETTMLMKMDPGAYSPPHSHQQLEEILVIEGDFFDAEHQYKSGQYCIRAIGAMHEAGSKEGGVVLLVYRN